MINGVNNNQAVTQKYEVSRKQENIKSTSKAQAKSQEAAAVLELGKMDNAAATYSKSVVSVTQTTSVTQTSSVIQTSPVMQAASVTQTTSVTLSTERSDETEKTSKFNAEEINRLWAEANKATQNLRDMVEQLLKSQGKSFKDVLSGKEELIVDEKTRAAAQQAISEDGECGVKAVSDRIVAFAKAISNDNPEMYNKLMSAIDEGFAQAEKALGGELPDICKKTREEVCRKMEEWKSGEVEVS